VCVIYFLSSYLPSGLNVNDLLYKLVHNRQPTMSSERISEVVEEATLQEPQTPLAAPVLSAPAAAAPSEAPAEPTPEAPKTGPAYEPGNVNLSSVLGWVTRALNPNITVTSMDLKTIYALVMWTFLNAHHVPESGDLTGIEPVKGDGEIYVSEEELTRICKIAFNPLFKQYFRNILLV
jgi:hypothetical protein